jgi:hypothetical protein
MPAATAEARSAATKKAWLKRKRKSVQPPSLPWVDPPPPRGVPGRKPGGFTATGATNTSMGDLAEKLTEQIGLHSLLRPGIRQGAMDRGIGDYAFEVKARTVQAIEYKAGPKKPEADRKRAWAKEHGLKAAMMIVVLDEENGTGYAYWKDGVGAYRLTGPKQGWNFAGKVTL